jgi:hypothetical protein
MTRTSVRTAVNQDLENNSAFFPEETLNNAIQEGYDEVATYCGLLEKRTLLPLLANTTYYDFSSLYADFYSVSKIYNRTTKRWLDPKPREWLDNLREDWETMVGEPRWFTQISAKYVAIVPRHTTIVGVCDIFYLAQAPTINDDTVIQLPRESEQILENFSLTQCMEIAKEFGKASKFDIQYEILLEKLRRNMSSRATPDRLYTLRG